MKHSFLCALVLLVFCVVPSFCLAAAKNIARGGCATIVIAQDNFLLQQWGENKPVIHSAGDTVTVELIGDTCYVNGQPYKPSRKISPKIRSVEQLKERFGEVPFILEYVRNHPGDSTGV